MEIENKDVIINNGGDNNNSSGGDNLNNNNDNNGAGSGENGSPDAVTNTVQQDGDPAGGEKNKSGEPTPSTLEDISSLKLKWEEERTNFQSTLQKAESELNEYKKYKNDYFELLDHYDGKKVFANEHLRKTNEILKKFPDNDPEVISSILSKDINSLAPKEALVLADKLVMKSIPGVTDEDRFEGILDDLRISSADLESLDGKDRYRLQVAVKKAKEQLLDIVSKSGSPEENVFDIEAAKQARSEQLEAERTNTIKQWTPVNTTLLKAFDGFTQQIKDEKGNVVLDYAYKADDKFRQEYLETLNDTLMSAGVKPTKENFQSVYSLIHREFIINNFEKIVNDVYKSAFTKAKEQFHALNHNDKPTQTGLNQARQTNVTGKTLREAYGSGS